MKRAAYALLLSAFVTPSAPAAPLESLDTDGWHTWRVEAAEGAPAWCCFTWDGDRTVSRTCHLDSHSGYGSCNDNMLNGFAQIYAKVESGKTVELRVLSPDCPVEVDGGTADHGEVDVDESLRWLNGLVKGNSRVSEDAVMAIAEHRGESAVDALIAVLENRGLHQDVREKALFWLAQSESDRALKVFERLLAGGDT